MALVFLSKNENYKDIYRVWCAPVTTEMLMHVTYETTLIKVISGSRQWKGSWLCFFYTAGLIFYCVYPSLWAHSIWICCIQTLAQSAVLTRSLIYFHAEQLASFRSKATDCTSDHDHLSCKCLSCVTRRIWRQKEAGSVLFARGKITQRHACW